MMTPSSDRDTWAAIRNGFLGGCPNCRRGKLFRSYLKVADHCPACGIELHHHRTDEAPPYFTIFIVGHMIVPLIWLVETTWRPPVWVHLVIWLPLVASLSLVLLPAVKGAVVGMQWAMRMYGFAIVVHRHDGQVRESEVDAADMAAMQR